MRFSGSSGIRMKWSNELLNFAHEIGVALGNKYRSVVVASDFRETSSSLVSTVISGLMAGGAEVYYGGKVPTPTLAYGAKNHDMGVMITASHNPPEYNGIKFFNQDGSAFTDEQMNIENGKIKDWNEVGKFHVENILDMHRESLLREFGDLDLNVVIDCSNGCGSVLTPFLFRELNSKVTTLNCHPSGQFPGHPSEPTRENLEYLRRMVLKKKADLGIGHDGDADRFIAITSSGRYLNGDQILAIFAKVLGFREIVAPVDSSMLLENFARVIRCKVGDANVSQKMKKMGVKFGGENSGTQIFASWRYTPDAIYASLKFSDIVMRNDIDSIIDDFPPYYTVRKSIIYENRDEIERKIEKFVEEYQVERIDGYRAKFDGGWFLIRFSGTEPKVRITVESEDKNKSEKMMNDIIKNLGGA